MSRYCAGSGEPFGFERGQHFIAPAFERVYPHIKRRALVDAAAESENIGFAQMLGERVEQPLRQLGGGVGAAGEFGFARFEFAQKFGTLFIQQRFDLAQVDAAPEHQRGQRGFFRLRVRAAQGGADFLIMAQGSECGFGDFMAVAAAKLAVGAEIGRQHGIGRLLAVLFLTPVFWLFFVPFGLLLRAGRRDRLERWFDPAAPSYWHRRDDAPRSKSSYEKAF